MFAQELRKVKEITNSTIFIFIILKSYYNLQSKLIFKFDRNNILAAYFIWRAIKNFLKLSYDNSSLKIL
jgi:hypothetical protein